MPRQEINLYRSFQSPVSTSDFLTWKRLWISNVIIILVLFLIYIFSLVEVMQLKSAKKDLQNQVIVLQKKFNATKMAYPQFFFSQNVHESIGQLEKDIETREKILSTITNNVPFSQVLMAFSELIIPNVWLTQITLTKGGQEILLKGHSISMSNLQRFLANIMQHKFFAGSILNINNVDKSKVDKDDNLTFEISIVKKTS